MRHRPTPVIVASILAGATTLMVPVGASAAASGNVRVAAFSAAPSVTIGTRVGVSGRVAPARSVRVLIQRHRDDGTWTLAGTVRSAADGRFSGMVPLAAGTSLRAAVVRGDGGLRTSSRRYVRVSRLLELSVSAPPYEDIVGRPFRVKGVVRPGGPGDAVTVEGSRGRRFIDLGTVRQKSGKVVHAWAFAGDCDAAAIRSNTFTMEWPPRSGQLQEFPEVDRAAFFSVEEATARINPGQVPLLERLVQQVEEGGASA